MPVQTTYTQARGRLSELLDRATQDRGTTFSSRSVSLALRMALGINPGDGGGASGSSLVNRRNRCPSIWLAQLSPQCGLDKDGPANACC